MASNNTHRRRAQQKKQLARSNSSFLDAIKNIVTAPLAWLTGNDDFEVSKGKRRQPSSAEDEVATPRTKRPRIESSNPPSTAYLDPPSNLFNQHLSVQDSSYNSTLSLSNTVRSTLSPLRNLGISRTMSLDPPSRFLRRESAVAQISIRNDSFDTTRPPIQRDLSMPPLSVSTRPSLRIRSSATPQPPQPAARDPSEPPPLSSLAINPVFVRAPSSQPTESQPRNSSTQTTTLGSLADSTRSTRSPVRQHSSLLFSTSPSAQTQILGQQSPAEKALHELDIYKTPLLPTRLRSSADVAQSSGLIASSGAPDLFKSRRTQKLVLMQDEKPSVRLGAHTKKLPPANDTKPYAGEGGMKKLLARHKLEVAEEEDHDQMTQDSNNNAIDEDGTKAEELVVLEPISGPATGKPDWFAVTSSEIQPLASSSSLRVGRDKKRNHIARPKASSARSRFSAAFDEDMDEVMDDGAVDEVKLTVSRQAFVFCPPPGFSFTQNTQNTPSDTNELPISSLPFSLTKKPQGPSADTPKPFSPPAAGKVFATTQVEMSNNVLPDAKPSSSVPDFFANSKILSKPVDIPPQTLTLTTARKVEENVAPASTGLVSGGRVFVHAASTNRDLELAMKPIIDGGRAPMSVPELPTSAASTPIPHFALSTIRPPMSDAAPSTSAIAGQLPMVETVETPEGTAPVHLRSNHTTAESKNAAVVDTAMPSTSSSDAIARSVPLPADLASTAHPATGEAEDFMNTSGNNERKESLINPAINQTSGLSDDIGKPLQSPFSFAQPSSNMESLKTRVTSVSESTGPKNSFSGFAFSQATETKDKEKQTAGFTFGAPSGPLAQPEQKKTLPSFAFGAPQPQPSPPISANVFSFGGGGSVASDVSKPFAFGASATAPSERPVTPPRAQDQEVQMEESPTREVQPTDGKPQATLGFSFGATPALGSLFGAQNDRNLGESSSPFTFGPSSNAFATSTQESKHAQDTPTSFAAQTSAFSFGQGKGVESRTAAQSPTTAPFSFGQSKGLESGTAAQSPTTAPFSFGQSKGLESGTAAQSPTTAPFSFGQSNGPESGTTAQSPTTTPFSFGSSATTFGFGAPESSTSHPFGQAHTSSAPSSPVTFGAGMSSFPFGTSTTTPNAAFAFGSSQPASPAGSGNLALPQAASSAGFGNAGFGQSAPSSPFSTSSPLTPSAPSGTLFTIGSAPAPAPGASRQIKKLPNRRGGAKR